MNLGSILGKFLEKNAGSCSAGVVVNARSGDGGGLETGADTAVVVEKPPAKPSLFEVFDGYPLPFGWWCEFCGCFWQCHVSYSLLDSSL